MNQLLRLPLYLLLAFILAVFAPILLECFSPWVRVDFFLPLAVYIANNERIGTVAFSGWFMGILYDVVYTLPTGVGLFSLNLTMCVVAAISQWLSIRSPVVMAAVCIPAALFNEFVKFLVLSIMGRQTCLSFFSLLTFSFNTALVGAAVFFILDNMNKRMEIFGIKRRNKMIEK